MTSTLPEGLNSLLRFKPLEDLILAALRAKFDELVPIQTLVRPDQDFPLVLVFRGDDWGRWTGDLRFVDSGLLVVHTLADGLNADEDAAKLGEAVRTALVDSVNVVMPGLGHLTWVDPVIAPHRVPDWGTTTGPVQYADLPEGVVRYEASYEVAFKRPIT